MRESEAFLSFFHSIRSLLVGVIDAAVVVVIIYLFACVSELAMTVATGGIVILPDNQRRKDW